MVRFPWPARILRDNPNYRYTWFGQIVSEIGDHFNSIAVLSLALHLTGSGVAVGGVMISRALPRCWRDRSPAYC